MLILACALSVSPQVRAGSHDAEALATVVAEHEAEIAAHGHAHDDLDLEQHAFDNHWPEIADYEHTPAGLPETPPGTAVHPRTGVLFEMAERQRSGLVRPFERPPRG